MTTLPQFLNYNFVKPMGFPCKIRQEKFTPIAFNTSTTGVSSSDVIRFNISNDGYWDPYSAYIKIEVDVSQADGIKNNTASQSVGSQQLDNSAHSFINQLIIYKEGTELERIEEYDILAAMLNDIHGSNDNRATRYFEGMNSSQMNFGNQYQNTAQQIFPATPTLTNGFLSGYNPLVTTQFGASNYNYDYNSLNSNTVAATQGSANNLNRYEYILNCDDSKLSLQTTTPTQVSNYGTRTVLGSGATDKLMNGGVLAGYKQPFCPQLSNYGNEPLLTKNFPQFNTYKGALGQYTYNDRMTFCIPILSGILGVLMPQESYKYIPMKALQDLILEFRLSPHALFTSGYADVQTLSQDANAKAVMGSTTNPMLTRSWKITKFEINVEMQYFESDIDSIILSRMNTTNGIILHTQSWLLGPRFSINQGTNASGTYQINMAFESLKNVLFCFIPDDYLSYSFCRKQYRLSQNITQMYLKLGNNYYPPLPVTGHAGNSSGYQSINNEFDYSNAEFLVQLYSSFGKFHDIQANSLINPINFAVNQRAYDPTNKQAFITIVASPASATYNNLDTPCSLPLFHENRCIGRACYAMNLETLESDSTILSGFRTIGISPYEITLKSDQTNPYPRSVTMYVFNNFDMLLQLGKNGVQVHGRG